MPTISAPNSRLCQNYQNPAFVGNTLTGTPTCISSSMPGPITSCLEMRASRAGESSSGSSSSSSTSTSSGRRQYTADELERLREAAQCPDAFERLSLNMKSESADGCIDEGAKPEEVAPKNKTKGGYQRIEDWDADQKTRQDGSGMTWEERCMFDGQRHGNQVRQNDILIRNLHTW